MKKIALKKYNSFHRGILKVNNNYSYFLLIVLLYIVLINFQDFLEKYLHRPGFVLSMDLSHAHS
jgi:hypothetical protein